MANELINNTKVLTEVTGMLRISLGYGPTKLFPLYTRYVAMNAPKNITSDPRKVHISSFLLLNPVEVIWLSTCWLCSMAMFVNYLYAPDI
tara:strand:- start:1473 stop:1742 length:270 start_codon:yes stop_codon:yes gene_type:complete